MKKISKIILSTILIISILGGCSYTNITPSENEPFMTELEYKDLYVNQMKVKMEKYRNVELNTIEMYDVPEDLTNIIRSKTRDLLLDINLNLGFTSPYYIHENFKHTLDNLVLDGSSNIAVSRSGDYYYAFVKGNFKKNPTLDELRKIANYVGIKGVIGYDENHLESVDTIYLQMLLEKVNKYREANNLDPLDTEIEQINYLNDFDADSLFTDTELLDIADISTFSETVKEDNSEDYLIDKENDLFVEITNEEDLKNLNIDNFGRKVRRLNYNSKEFNDLIGIIRDVEPIIPNINAIFKIPTARVLSGYSLYDWGGTIKEVKNNPIKEIELVFIFKHDLEEDDFKLYGFYPNYIKSNIDIKKTDNLYISSFLKSTIESTIERLHRCWCNKSFTGLTSGELIYPQDLGLYLLKERDSINLSNSNMWLDEILRREQNTYLCTVYQIDTENIKETYGTSAKFIKKWLMRFIIKNTKCIIDDMYLLESNCIRIPESPIEKGSLHKLYSIGNSSIREVPNEQKEEIRKELDKLAIGISNGKYHDILTDDGKITYTDSGIPRYGFDDRFNMDTTILPAKTREEYINQIKSMITTYTNKQYLNVYIIPTSDWISSESDQVELCANILFDYGNNAQLWEKVYLVYSNYRNKWVIDEMTINNVSVWEGQKYRDYIFEKFKQYIDSKNTEKENNSQAVK